MNEFKYYTPEGIKETNDEELAKKMSDLYKQPYMAGNCVRSGGCGRWYWRFKNEHYPRNITMPSSHMGWNQF